MSNPFKPDNSAVDKPKRNSFDLSFSSHLTFNFGQLIPVMCKEVLPGDTFKIDAALGLRFMPLAFPIQTKCRAHVHFFYQRTKNLWPEFVNFIYGNDKISGVSTSRSVPPTLDPTSPNFRSMLQTCSLGDYLGLPTTRNFGPAPSGLETDLRFVLEQRDSFPLLLYAHNSDDQPAIFPDFPALADLRSLDVSRVYTPVVGAPRYYYQLPFRFVFAGKDRYRFQVDVPKRYFPLNVSDPRFVVYFSNHKVAGSGVCSVEDAVISKLDSSGQAVEMPVWRFYADFSGPDAGNSQIGIFTLCVPISGPFDIDDEFKYPVGHCYRLPAYVLDAVDSGVETPFDNRELSISALPFRCYESIYNAFYRDNRNNPFTDPATGNKEYNKYLPNDRGGYDDTLYSIRNRNWEYDQFTSAVQSPQQGTAPLVGISSLGDVTFSHDGKEYTFRAETAPDADTITKVNVTENVPAPVARSIVNVVTSGISINDFRNVNSYQRWLETNIRRGLKYKDQTLARWGVLPADSTLDMPEFIGGFSVDVDINTVTNTSAGTDVPLGDYAAQATAFGGSKHRISQYCDQHGFIMAIVSVIPTPVYTQLLPKMFTRMSALDYYSPEFSRIGMQAVRYSELCPLECGNPLDANKTEVTDVFGYQRPWYEYIYSNDEAHGLFRTDFNQFLLSRLFYRPPRLGPDFLTVSPGSLNDIFTVHNRNNILGMIRFNIEAQRPIPQISVPSL
ncbi:major capsid protein [Dipodfec virus UOA04_Rod_611]|nr:major capsid protein [Dipodfec virus UOA04_Rod_611]